MRLPIHSILLSIIALITASACGGGGEAAGTLDGGSQVSTLDGTFADSPVSDESGPSEAASSSADGAEAGVNVCAGPDGGLDCSNPACVAPALDLTVPSSLYQSTLFLYQAPTSGSCQGIAPQSGVAAGTIVPSRVAAIHGAVTDRSGNALRGVAVTVVGHPEYGQVSTAPDGSYTIVVNGGGQLALRYTLTGYLPLQRHLETQWNQYGYVDTATLTLTPSAVTQVNLGGIASTIVGTTATDSAGTRTPFVFVPAGSQASLVMPNGTTSPLSSFHTRIAEYTVGTSGRTSMPADLPPTSEYTFCASFAVDEATAQGATSVAFDPPLPTYVENYLGFPVGATVPAGAYHPESDSWETSQSGVVLSIVAVQGGVASVDTDGDGVADPPATLASLGITNDELTALGGRYIAGQQLWRVALPHFSDWDLNWSWIPPPNAIFPTPSASNGDEDCSSSLPGSIIHCENRTLGEVIPVPGSGHALVYDSARTDERPTDYTTNIQVTPATIPNTLLTVLMRVTIAGQVFEYQYTPPTPNLVQPFTWNGLDAWGRRLQGRQPLTVWIRFVYAADFGSTSVFGGYPGGSITIVEGYGWAEAYLTSQWTGFLGSWSAKPLGFGGWSLAEQNVYDPSEGILYLGAGGRRSVTSLGNSLASVAGTGSPGYSGDGAQAAGAAISGPHGIVVAPDGTAYFADELNQRVRMISPTGAITTIAGTGTAGFGGDGGPATAAMLNHPMGLALGPDGSLYIADSTNGRVRRVAPTGAISTYAGNGTLGLSGDGGPAVQAELSGPHALAMGPNGALYITDSGNQTVRVVTADGVINRVAGTGTEGFSGNGGPGAAAQIADPLGITVAADGTVYVAEWGNNLIRAISPGGTISTFAGSTTSGYDGDGGPATSAALSNPHTVDLAADGSLYVSDEGNVCVRKISPDGIIQTVAGRGHTNLSVSGPPLAAQFSLPRVVFVHTDGSVWVADYTADRILRLLPTQAIATSTQYLFPSADGKQIYAFDTNGRQLATIDAETAVTLRQFTYDTSEHLATVTDAYGNTTTFAHDAAGCLSSVTGPFGAVTTFTCDGNGYLSTATDPTGASTSLVHGSDGLLTQLTTPLGDVHSFAYDMSGLLVTDSKPWGGSHTLTPSATQTGTRVTDTTAQGRITTFDVSPVTNGGETRTLTLPSGAVSTYTMKANGQTVATLPDQSTVTISSLPDPRFGMMSPLETTTTTLPLNPTSTVTEGRTVTLANAGDPIHASTIVETYSLNGATWSRKVNVAAGTVTRASPTSRSVVAHLGTHGELVELDVPNRSAVTTQYDSFGRQTQIVQGARTTSLAYDTRGYLASVTDPLDQVWSYTHDADGRVTSVTRPDGATLGSSFDANGNTKTVTPPATGAHSFSYQKELLGAYVPPLLVAGGPSNPTQYSYTLDGDLAALTRADGASITPAYDSAGRVTSLTGAGVSLAYTYNATSSQLAGASNGSEGLLFTYDGSFPTAYVWSGQVNGRVLFATDANLRLGTETAAGSPISYVYDADGLVTSAGAEAITWNSQDGSLSGATVAQYTESYGYDSTYGELGQLQATISSSAIYSVSYTRDALGRIFTRTETIGGVAATYGYSYDGAQRLANVTTGGTTTAAYTYDANGNRQTTGGGETYDAQDRLTQKGTTSYAYTLQGELETKTTGSQVTQYSYDGTGALRSVSLPSGKAITYVIDGLGRRVGKVVNGTLTTGFLYGAAQGPAAMLDGNNNLVARFVYGESAVVPDYMVMGATTYRLVKDERGSVRLVVNAQTGAVAERVDYNEWGVVTNDTSPGFQPFGYAGGLYDADTGLVRFGARDYDASVGRWTNKDPGKFAGGANFYAYAHGDPINYVDPSGHEEVLALVGAALGGVIGGTLDLSKQIQQGGCIDWGEVGLAAGVGAVVGGVAGFLMDPAVFGELGEAEAEFSTATRAAQLAEDIPTAQAGRITMAVGLAEDEAGTQSVLVGTSEPGGYLRPGVTLDPGEILVGGEGHAEENLANYAQENGLSLKQVGATRPICSECAALLEAIGAEPTTPLKVP
jgi:RHS repeat-associated protein